MLKTFSALSYPDSDVQKGEKIHLTDYLFVDKIHSKKCKYQNARQSLSGVSRVFQAINGIVFVEKIQRHCSTNFVRLLTETLTIYQ